MKRFRNLRHFGNNVRVQLRHANRRRPLDGGLPAMAEPPRGPLPLAGGAEASLEFDD